MNTQNKRISQVKSHFDGEAAIFDARIVNVVPHYMEMLDALVTALPYSPGKKIRVADLGCGTGTVSFLVKSRFPHAHITCVDMAENMLDLAARKMKRFNNVKFELGELTSYRFKGRYDAVVSSLALHHLEGRKKTALFKRIGEALAGGGVFANADIIVSADASVQKKYLGKWEEFILKSYAKRHVRQNHEMYLREDRPAALSDELRNLKAAGFRNVELFWKYYNFAVYCAEK